MSRADRAVTYDRGPNFHKIFFIHITSAGRFLAGGDCDV